jgi:hypothetical protein
MLKFSLDKEKKHDENGRPWYDTKQGIIDSLVSLPSFLALIHERHEAGYDRDERLNEFYVLGWYSLDTCGNCSRASGIIPKKVFPNIPDVLTREEFEVYARTQCKDDKLLGFTFSMEYNLPRPNTTCALCGNRWTIQDCHDIIVWRDTEVIPLTAFVGKTLGEVKKHYESLTNAIYFMQGDILIRNDRFIDLSPRYPHPKDKWEKGVVKNERGWVSEREGITNDYVIQPGDEGFFNVWKYYHRNCNKKNLAKGEKKRFREVFEKAGFKDIRMSQIKNEYCSCERCAPWFQVNTEFGSFKIGWRKRVINLDWSEAEKAEQDVSGQKLNLIDLFKKEDVTKGNTYIHAWGWEEAEDYLKRIYNRLVKVMA